MDNVPISPDPAYIPATGIAPALPPLSGQPIRFPHIPSKSMAPGAGSRWLDSEGVLAHRIDLRHLSQNAIPGIRTPTVENETLDHEPLPAIPPVKDRERSGLKSESILLSEQMRRRLVDFGNTLTAENLPNNRLERAFEIVCRSYSELAKSLSKSLAEPKAPDE